MSSILDFGPHTVTIFPEVEVDDSRGNAMKRPSTTGVVVTGCLVQPIASTRGAFAAVDVRQGQRIDVAYRFFARTAPLGWWSYLEWEGIRMVLLGGPLKYRASDGTTHISATLKEER